MGAHQVDIGLRDGTHADLIVRSGEEGCKRAGKRHRAVSGGAADGHTDLQSHLKKDFTL